MNYLYLDAYSTIQNKAMTNEEWKKAHADAEKISEVYAKRTSEESSKEWFDYVNKYYIDLLPKRKTALEAQNKAALEKLKDDFMTRMEKKAEAELAKELIRNPPPPPGPSP